MTKFNPENKEILNYGECLKPAMKIQTEADAVQYKRDYIAYTQKFLDKEPRTDGKTAEDIVNENLGYFAGYYDNETRERVERLFCTKHPIFGSIESNGIPTAKEAFIFGLNATQNKYKVNLL